MNEVLSHPEAAIELEKAADYLEEHREGYGELFRAEVEALIERATRSIAAIPLYRNSECRRARLTTFPHWLYFFENGDDVWLVAIAHPKRRLGYWLDRLDDIRGMNPPTTDDTTA